ncbi:MAG: hypothetical protein DME20_07640 [Verrucomicrobia bacterium]|nr:MAG: hypothetical protein DME20_07640 [Verrucomicrobiota bacterium]
MIRFVAICSLAIAFIAEANAQKVWIQNGNVCVSNGGESKTLTTSGRDSEPVLSPDGKWIVFVRTARLFLERSLGDIGSASRCRYDEHQGTFCLSDARVRSGSFRRVSRLSFGRAASLFHRRRQLQLVLAAAARRQGRGAGWRRHGKFQSHLPQGLT